MSTTFFGVTTLLTCCTSKRTWHTNQPFDMVRHIISLAKMYSTATETETQFIN